MKNLNIRVIGSFLGLTSLLNGFFMILTAPISIYHNETEYLGILKAGIATLLFGGFLWFINRNAAKNIQKKEGYLIVTLGWLMLSVTGTLPYLLTGTIPNFTDAFFETISGYSTTGSSIVNSIESLPKGILFWRSATHWIGGMGIIVLTVAILPLLGIGGMQLFISEAPGPSHDKLHPRITQTAKRLWMIYLFLTLFQSLLLKFAGMSWFDAVNHAMSTISTGGFSTKNDSIAYWNNAPLIQYIITIFMFIAGTNFILSYFALKGKIYKILNNEEFRYYFLSILCIGVFISLILLNSQEVNLNSELTSVNSKETTESVFRHSFFQVISIITTTGFVTADFTLWSSFATMLIFSLFFVGGSAGSTSGGVKIVRHIIILKNSFLELKKAIHPNAILPVRYNSKPVSEAIIHNVLSFFVLYMFIFFASSVILSLLGMDFLSAIGAAASSLGNIGPALGSVSPVNNFAHLSDAAKWFCSFLMLLGRLELFTVIILLSPFFWRKN